MNRFFVVSNQSKKGEWTECVWSDIFDLATYYYDNNVLNSALLRRLKSIHFSNKINSIIWLPFKFIWDKSLCIQEHNLDKDDRNYIIFHSNVKFSPSYIKRLKMKKNVCIVLYLPDTSQALGIGDSQKKIERYKKYYGIDYIFSFDINECNKYSYRFFDIYSTRKMSSNKNSTGVFYIGSCRSEERRQILVKMFNKLKCHIKCDFNLIGVDEGKQEYANEIIYNKPLSYSDVLIKVNHHNCILEIVNKYQSGNTLRFKEAVCYNKKLLTNNHFVKNSPYFNEKYIQVFQDINTVDIDWINDNIDVDYNYKGEFSPRKLIEMIIATDNQEN